MTLRDDGRVVTDNFKRVLEIITGTKDIIDNKGATFHAAAERVLSLNEVCTELQASAKGFLTALRKMKANTREHESYASGLMDHTATLQASLKAWVKHYDGEAQHDRKEDTRLKNHLGGLLGAWVKDYLPPMFNACVGMGLESEKVLFLESEIIKLARKLRVRIRLRLTDEHES